MSPPLCLLIAALLLAACSGPEPGPPPASTAAPAPAPAPFPLLPTSPEAARALIARETTRAPGPDPAIDAAAILAAMDRPGAIVAGHAAVVRFVQAFLDRAPAGAFVLFGTYHDAAGQIEAFRRIVGPGGLAGLTVIAAEQLRADGAWHGAPAEVQRGDGAAIDAFVLRGDAGAFAALSASHRDADYAAWKFGYEPVVLDLLVAARAAGVRFMGCDMPRPLLALAGPLPDDERNRLREIHCLHALAAIGGAPRRAALLWGQAHVGPGGSAASSRPPRRPSRSTPSAIARPSTEARCPGASRPRSRRRSCSTIPRSCRSARTPRPCCSPTRGWVAASIASSPRTTRRSRASRRGRQPRASSWWAARGSPSRAIRVELPLAPGGYTYVFSGAGRRVVGSVLLLPGRRVEIGFDPAARLTSYLERRRPGDP